ncbi:hypothetical protein IQ268_14575, partial [Oculatella sp. LEGE 06141]|uniref:hypothetical protein n=1 Tax=Oculatella sp. LEGE 06141 TaxID=1828648 RepID=UPI0018802BF6
MVDPIDDIAHQARQGSVSAIIQILNQKLADSGVRTRAILSDGILQLLCEAPRPEQLEQPTLVPQIRQILESIQPRNIHRVSINSRIVREQQLLWLDEINRDPDSQLLWSEQVTLKKSNPFKRFSEDWQFGRSQAAKAIMPKVGSGKSTREKRQFRRGIIGGTGISLLVLLAGWGLYEWLEERPEQQTQATPTPSPNSSATVAASPDAPAIATPTPTAT